MFATGSMTAQGRRPAVLNRGTGQRRHRPDYGLLLMSVALLVVGLIVVYAISPALSVQREVGENYFVVKQLTAIGLGVLAFTVMAAIPLGRWRQLQR